jgi:hypothetical protein
VLIYEGFGSAHGRDAVQDTELGDVFGGYCEQAAGRAEDGFGFLVGGHLL